MKDILLAASRLQQLLGEAHYPSCFIGGVAVQRWGEVRVTKDADAAVLAGLGDEDKVIGFLKRHYDIRNPDALRLARIHRVILLTDRLDGVGLDLSLAASGFEQTAIKRGSDFRFGEGVTLRTCSAEDLIIYKAIADRTLDWHDIKGILIRQQGKLDFDQIDRELTPLVALKEEPRILDQWHELRDRYR